MEKTGEIVEEKKSTSPPPPPRARSSADADVPRQTREKFAEEIVRELRRGAEKADGTRNSMRK